MRMETLLQVLRYAGTLYQRAFLAVAATLYAASIFVSPSLDSFIFCGSRPRVLVIPSHYELAVFLIFTIDAIALWWRIFDTRARIICGTIVNFYTAVLWLTVTIAGMFVYDGVWSANVGEIMLTLTSLFVLTRTDYNASDKGTA